MSVPDAKTFDTNYHELSRIVGIGSIFQFMIIRVIRVKPSELALAGKSVKLVTFWGVNDTLSWRANGKPLLFDGNNQPKPAFNAVLRAATGKPGNPKSN